MKTYGFILLMAVCGAVACSANAGGGNTPTPPADSGTPPADTGSTPTDTGSSTPTDRGTTPPADRGSTMNAPCSPIIPQLCTCGMNASCQQMALGSNQSCGMCLAGAIQSCCPAEVTNLTNCVQAMMCGQNDQMCWQMRCPMEFNALNQCNATSQMQAQMTGSGACYDAYVGCFGQFPITCM